MKYIVSESYIEDTARVDSGYRVISYETVSSRKRVQNVQRLVMQLFVLLLTTAHVKVNLYTRLAA